MKLKLKEMLIDFVENMGHDEFEGPYEFEDWQLEKVIDTVLEWIKEDEEISILEDLSEDDIDDMFGRAMDFHWNDFLYEG